MIRARPRRHERTVDLLWLQRAMTYVRAEWVLVSLLVLTVVLRVPSLFEPLWYGDEAVYLTIGQQLLRGDLLYVDIFDNKPPLLYYLTAGSLAVFGHSVVAIKLLALVFSVGALLAFYHLAQLLLDKRAALLGVVILSLLITPTWLEGNVVSSEILMVLPTCVGVLLGFQRRFFVAGCCFGLAFLLKVPAIFDFGAFFVFVALGVERGFERQTLWHLFRLTAGLFAPFALTIAFFGVQGGLDEYLNAVFFSGVDFTSSDQTTTANDKFLFSHGRLLLNALPVLLLVSALALRTLRRWRAEQANTVTEFEFMLLWLVFAFYGALLAGRAHEHYLIQVAPPFALLMSFVLTRADYRRFFGAAALLLVVAIALDQDFELMKVSLNGQQQSTLDNYQDYNDNFFDYATGDKSFVDYANDFDGHMTVDARIAQRLHEDGAGHDDSLYVFSDQTAIYFRSGLQPAARYIAYYHLEWDQSRKPETAAELANNPPRYIVAEEPPENVFVELEEIITEMYELIASEGTLRLYRRLD
jgi:hypothetical protein